MGMSTNVQKSAGPDWSTVTKGGVKWEKRYWFLGACIGIILAGVGLLLTATPGAAQQEKTIRIGILCAQSAGFPPSRLLDVADLMNMQKMINEKGGLTIKGQKYDVEVVVGKTSIVPSHTTTAAVNSLVFDKRVKFSSSEGAASSDPPRHPVLNPNKVMYVLKLTPLLSPAHFGQTSRTGFSAMMRAWDTRSWP